MNEQIIQIGNQSLNYKHYASNNSKGDIVILHGWGGKSDSWASVAEILQKNSYDIYIPDIPGFGKSPIKKVYTIAKYAELIELFLGELKIKPKLLLGHSNGGAISAQIISNNNVEVEKLVLNNSAGVRQNLKRRAKRLVLKPIVIVAKIFSFIPFYSKFRSLAYRAIGSGDYVNAEKQNHHLKASYQNMIGAEMKDQFQSIKIPTLLLWGKNDKMTPLSDASFMRANIKDSELVVIENQGHSIHLKNPIELSKNILEFLK